MLIRLQDGIQLGEGGGVKSFNGRTGIVVPEAGDYDKTMVGLGNVDNTSDLDKPISTATQTALDLKANISDIPTKVSDLTNDSHFITEQTMISYVSMMVLGGSD